MEALTAVRRRLPPSPLHSTLIYGVQAFLGYLLMFVIMMFSIEMIFAVVFGLMAGHVLFGNDRVYRDSDEPVHEETRE